MSEDITVNLKNNINLGLNILGYSSGGVTNFWEMNDTPNSYTGFAENFLLVNSSQNGIKFAETVPISTVYNLQQVLDDKEPANSNIQSHISSTSNPHSVTKLQVGLGSVQDIDTTTTSNITDSSNKRFITDAEKTILSNTSNTNTGDETQSTIKNKLGDASVNSDGYLRSTDFNTFKNKAEVSDIPTSLSELTEDSTHRTVTDVEKSTWNNKLDSYNETDPVFTAWDKSTGISITESQISDLGDYATLSELTTGLSGKVDKVTGKGLSTEDYTTAEKSKLAGIAENANNYVLPSDVVQDSSYVHTDNNFTDEEQSKLAGLDSADYEPANTNIQSHISNTLNPHSVTATQLGLGNVDNTSDANKPVSTATQTALNLKANLAGGNTFTGNQIFDTNTLFIDSVNDRVGVGTVSPARQLVINHASQPTWGMYINGAEGVVFKSDANKSFLVDVDGTNVFNIHGTTKQVGIGTASPSNKLQVYSTSGRVATFGDIGIAVATGTPVNVSFGSTYGANVAGSKENLKWDLYTSSISPNRYGIGMSVGLIEIQAGGGGAVGLFVNQGTEALRCTSSADVGIGTNSPSAKLHVKSRGATTANSFLVQNSSGTTNFQVQDNGTITAPALNRVGFSAFNSNTTVPATTWTTPTFLTEQDDTHSAFDGSVFTVPAGKGGLYQINAVYAFSSVSDGSMYIVAMDLNNTGAATHLIGRGVSGGTALCGAGGSLILNLSAGNTIRLKVYCSNATTGFNSVTGYCSFSATKLIV